MHVYIYIINIYIYDYICIYYQICIYIYQYIYIYLYVNISWVYMYTYTRMYTYTNIYPVCIYTYEYKYMIYSYSHTSCVYILLFLCHVTILGTNVSQTGRRRGAFSSRAGGTGCGTSWAGPGLVSTKRETWQSNRVYYQMKHLKSGYELGKCGVWVHM